MANASVSYPSFLPSLVVPVLRAQRRERVSGRSVGAEVAGAPVDVQVDGLLSVLELQIQQLGQDELRHARNQRHALRNRA